MPIRWWRQKATMLAQQTRRGGKKLATNLAKLAKDLIRKNKEEATQAMKPWKSQAVLAGQQDAQTRGMLQKVQEQHEK